MDAATATVSVPDDAERLELKTIKKDKKFKTLKSSSIATEDKISSRFTSSKRPLSTIFDELTKPS